MQTAAATRVFKIDNNFHYSENGLKFNRRYTREGVSPFEMFEYELRTSLIREPSGQIVFEMRDVEVPKTWSQVATDILAQKYFRKAGVPQYDANGQPLLDMNDAVVLGTEKSIKQVAHRLAGTWRYWAEKYGYFASAGDAQIFYDELVYMIINQMVAPNSPQWFNTGLYWAYGINGPAQGHHYVDPDTGVLTKSSDSYSHPQPHACFIQSVKDDLVNEGGIMDLWVREARLFKYGSGTGTNFSYLRGRGEKLSGGGSSSGLMSWLRIGDRAAGGIKSGGTTRRAAKMVILNVDHPDIEEFVGWKMSEEKKVAALIAAGYDASYEGDAYQTISGQNSNNSVRVSQSFMESVVRDNGWSLLRRTDGTEIKKLKARALWDHIATAAWSCADPGLQFDSTINDWHTCSKSGRINASNPCSEYMFLDDTACNLASINLIHYYDAATSTFDIDGFKHTTRLWAVVLEVSILMAQFPSAEIARNSYDFRTLGLGYANIGSVLMTAGIPYDSPQALAFSGCITALMTAQANITSAELARALGPFAKFLENRESMLRVMRNHRRAVFNVGEDEYEEVSIKPLGIDPQYAPAYLLASARESWNEVLEMGERYGFRNAQTTLLAPTGTIGLLMDCSTTGVEPDFALVKFKKLAGGGYFKIVNESVPSALKTLGYRPEEVNDIVNYLKGRGTLIGAPEINHQSLKAKGLTENELEKIEQILSTVFELSAAFNVWVLGEECLQRLGLPKDQYDDPSFNLLSAMGFTGEQINVANEFVCGAMTIEGAPHLKKEHYAVFDTANKNGRRGQRYIHYLGHIRMMAAVQPFLSGAISKTINMPNEATVEDVKIAHMASWKLGLKAIAIYRDGCKMAQPLSSKSKDNNKEIKKDEAVAVGSGTQAEKQIAAKSTTASAPTSVAVPASEAVKQYTLSSGEDVKRVVGANHAQTQYAHDGTVQGAKIYIHGEQRKLPYKRSGITIKANIGGQKLFMRTGEYPDGRLGEVFIDMYKEGAAFRSLLNLFAVSISTGLQYGVPLQEYVDKFTFTRFEPSGLTDHPNIKLCTSMVDFVFRVLGMEYLGRTDFVQVKPVGIQKNRAEQIAKLVSQTQGQTTIPLTPTVPQPATVVEDDEVEKEKIILKDYDARNQMSLPNLPANETVTNIQSSAADQQLAGMMGDAPPCPTCGHITIRNGSCYKCLNCGSTTGCS